MKIRKMHQKDLDKVIEIERKSFKMPWTRTFFKKLLDMENAAAIVAVNENDDILGYAIALDYGESLELANIAVHPDVRRKGIASKLLKKIIDLARNRGFRWVYLEVRESNTAARKLYEKFGFREAGRIKGYYQPDFEDAILYRLEVNRSGENQKAGT